MPDFLLTAATAFGLIFLAELPDKTMFASMAMGTRMRPLYVWFGTATAFGVHVGIAVAAGSVLGLLPDPAVKLAAAAMFAFGAVLLLRGGDDDVETEDGSRLEAFWPVYSAGFLTVFLAEWGDLTQITTASLAASRGAVPTALGAFLALISVSALALLAGRVIATRVPLVLVRRIGAGAMATLAVVTAVQALA